jgi:CRISPR/Cas system endoribonuclease Cas6 (RAMP superfamily)
MELIIGLILYLSSANTWEQAEHNWKDFTVSTPIAQIVEETIEDFENFGIETLIKYYFKTEDVRFISARVKFKLNEDLQPYDPITIVRIYKVRTDTYYDLYIQKEGMWHKEVN